jgi:EAL domain-containing protein (putative c-di-GMP-specific phosphodiesterase class I)
MVRAIATLGAGLGMAVAAVGVETASQARMAATDGCTDMQGFLLCKPVTAAEVPEILARDFEAALGGVLP